MIDNSVKKKQRQRWLIGLGAILAIVLLYFSLKDISWSEVWNTIRGANWGLFIIGIGLTMINLVIRGVRWGVLISGEMKIPPLTMLWAASVGYLGNLTLPARAGEVIRSAALSRRTGLSLGYIFATALTERVLDVLILVIIAIFSAPSLTNLPDWMKQSLPIMGILGGMAVVILVAAPRFEHFFIGIIQRMPVPKKWKQVLENFTCRFLLGGKAFLHPARAGGFLSFSAIIWLLDGLIAIIVGRSLDLTFTLAQVMLFLVGLGLSSAIPSTPGYLGCFKKPSVVLYAPITGNQCDRSRGGRIDRNLAVRFEEVE